MNFISSMACAFIVTCAHAAAPASKHIFVIILENQSYERVVGSSNAPYFNSLISQGALATQFFANVHGSFLVRQYLGRCGLLRVASIRRGWPTVSFPNGW